MRFDQDTLSILALAGVAAGGIALLVGASLASRVSFLKRAYGRRRTAITSDGGLGSGELAEEIRMMRAELQEIAGALHRSIQHVGLVRFDAFEDMGGLLSFSAALLDGSGDGIVLSTINGRTESRVYAKPVERGQGRHNLTEEEQEAVRRALAAAGR